MTMFSYVLRIKDLQFKNTQDSIAAIVMSLIISAIALQTIFHPYSTEDIPIPNLGGIFYRSILVIFIMSLVWIYRYGWVKAISLLIVYYGIQEFVFTNIFFGFYGQTMFEYLRFNILWDVRIFWMCSAVAVLGIYKWYRFNFNSVMTGLIFFGYFMLLLAIWPFSYFNGEGNIPLMPISQIEEFMYNLLFPIWFYFLVRRK